MSDSVCKVERINGFSINLVSSVGSALVGETKMSLVVKRSHAVGQRWAVK